MPKERSGRSVSRDRYRTSPFKCSSSNSRRHSPKIPLGTEGDPQEWEEARCPVCMEHPHNAVLLICSSHAKGCRPYMCDTSHRHSNCLDQFRKSFVETLPSASMPMQDNSSGSEPTASNIREERRVEEAHLSMNPVSCDNQAQAKLFCPLCRGKIKEWIVDEPARNFMNAKPRSCSCETCSFNGTYTDLRKHARQEHPLARPSEADPERQRNWRRLERQRDLGDLLSTLQSSFGEDRGDDSVLPIDDGGWLTVFFLIRVFRPESNSRSNSYQRARNQSTFRRSIRLWGESYEGETESSSRDEEHDSSDDESGNRRHRERIPRMTTPDNLP